MAERSHWWTERCLRSPLFRYLSLSFSDYLPTYLPTYLSIFYVSIYQSVYLSIYLSLSLSLSLFHLITYLITYLSHIHLGFAWQAWRSWHWEARLGWFWSPVTPRHFAWQAWHKVTPTLVLRGRRGTIWHLPSFCVAGVALMALGGALGLVLTARDAASAWQAWHKVTSTLVSRGRRSTISHSPWFCVAVVALMRHIAWQAWHNLTSTFILRGRRGTISHPPSFCVAGVAQSQIHLRFAWQARHLWHWVARLGSL